MSIKDVISSIDEKYKELKSNLYNKQNVIRQDPYISVDQLEDLESDMEELDEILEGSGLVEKIKELIQQNSAIYDLADFNEVSYSSEKFGEKLAEAEARDPENIDRDTLQAEADEEARAEKRSLVAAASKDIKELIIDLLPKLVH